MEGMLREEARAAGRPHAWGRLAGRVAAAAMAAIVAACGGGGGGGGEGADSTTPPPAPVITTQPAAQTVDDGAAASFSVAASGSGLAYQWQRNGSAVAGATAATYTIAAAALADDGARFSVVVSNSCGHVASNEAVLTVQAVAPRVVSAPAAASVVEGSTATFSVVAAGSAPLAYQWLRDGAEIAGATAASYTTPVLATGDSGATFSVRVSNVAGSVDTATAVLTVSASAAPPVIDASPQAAAVLVGQTATFSVSASGPGPLGYQWRRDGVPIAGATSASYTTPALVLADSGSRFSVVVTNAGGSTPSAEATLTVSVAAGPWGALTLGGAGLAGAGVGSSFVPTTAFVAGTFGPFCVFKPTGVLCDTSLSLQWNRSSNAFLTIGLASRDRPSPGSAPGYDVNGIVIVLTLDPSQPDPTRINFYCNYGTQALDCDFAALGITVDAASRTLRFSNTQVPLASGAGSVTLDGALNW